MSKKCKSCKLFATSACPVVSEGNVSDLNMTACESYKRKGYRTAAVTAITTNCADTSCRFWTDDLDQHPDNCLKGVNDRKKPGKDCNFWEFKPGVSDPKRCDKKDCLYYAKSSASKDNCNIAAFGEPECKYIPRKNTKMNAKSKDIIEKCFDCGKPIKIAALFTGENDNAGWKCLDGNIRCQKCFIKYASPENTIESNTGQKPLPFSVMLTREPSFEDLIKILQVILTDTGLEIIIRPTK